MDRLGSLVVIAPASRTGDPGSNPGSGENFSLKLLIYIYIYNYFDGSRFLNHQINQPLKYFVDYLMG